MAYCEKCGAYIPDGQTNCLACGYDKEAEATASQYAYAYDEDTAKQDYEAERARKQQENRQWAKEEYARRRREREAEARAEAERREAERAAQREQYDANKRSESGFTYTEGNSKVFATLSYISLGFLLQKMFLPDDEYAQFHSKQGERLFICGIAAEIIGGIFGLTWIAVLLRLGYTIRGIANAKNGDKTELPYINSLFKKK